MRRHTAAFLLCISCNSDTTPAQTAPADSGTDSTAPVDDLEVVSFALGCYAIDSGDGLLATSGASYDFNADSIDTAARFFMQPSDLGTYLFYDAGGYLVAEDGPISRETVLESDVTRIDDDYISGAEWILETSEVDPARYQLRNRRNNQLLAGTALTVDPATATPVSFVWTEGCTDHPELSVDATGTIGQTTFEDGDLYGIVDAHSHIMSNFAFGGGIFHGGAYHRLGVAHALPDCDVVHGEGGRRDFFGYVFDDGGNNASALETLLVDLLRGELSEDNHATDGYPTFSDWPDARRRSTHQTQYYRWLERAYLGGLRLVVQHATSNAMICNLSVGEGIQQARYDCEDMTAVDRIIDETWQMERYIDALHGGSNKGWFRIVESPAQAREVIAAGKMAVILGIETSDLFRCNITPRPGDPVCDESYVLEQLDTYYDRGVRVIFPVHKYDNQFSPGDGSGDYIELGNFFNSGHWTNKTEDCPTESMPTGFDGGKISFGGLQNPRDEYTAEAPIDFSGLSDDPISTMLPYTATLLEGSISGEWCQNGTLTDLGEVLMQGMMERGMIIEVDHFPLWSYKRAYEILEENNYPAAGTHGRDWDGRLFALGGISNISLGRCQDADSPGSTLQGFFDEVDLIEASGGYPAPALGFDFNGFAGAPGPRFGEDGCSDTQENAITYPFASYAGDIEFTAPYIGERLIDFDTEGMVHIGLLPELLQDARSDAVSDADLEPLFRSAEGYIRMWEKAEERAVDIRARE